MEEQISKSLNNQNSINSNPSSPIEPSPSSKIYQQQIVNPNKLFEKIKDLMSSDNYSLTKLYLFLMKLSNKSNYFGVKIQSILFQSQIALKEKNETESIRLGHKIISWINNLDLKKYNTDVIMTLIQVLSNSSEVCQENFPMLSCLFLFFAKNICRKCAIKTSYINDIIKIKFPFIIKKLTEKIQEIKDDILDKKNTIIRVGVELQKFLETSSQKIEIGQKFYVVNKKWIENFLNFTNKLSMEKIDIDSLFQINSICLAYFSNDNDKEDNNGIYCGEVNNFPIIIPKLTWPDLEEKYTNTFVNKKIMNNLNDKFIILNEEIHSKIKFYMGINFEIERIKTVEGNFNNIYNNIETNNVNIDIDDINLIPIKILFLNEEIRDREKEYVIIQNMQINKNQNLNDLISKIKRGFLGFLKEKKYEIFDYDYKIYLLDYNKPDIINLILTYVNLLKHYKIRGELINENDFITKNSSITIQELFSNKPKYICCEVINKSSIVVPFLIKYNPSKVSCATCNLTLDLNNTERKVFPCGFCSQNIYCSEKCKSNDSMHIEYHTKMSILCDNSLKSSDIEAIDIRIFFDKNSRNGLVGLINTGGIDFLLASIQALSSCETFTKFILTQSHKYLNDKYIAKDNTSLISCYTELINQMWAGSNSEVNPSKFRDLFFNQILKTSGQNNLDVLDILIILLDSFHQELNEYKKRNNMDDQLPFYKQQIGETDKVAAARWWKLHKSINDSIIVDLFQGQLKLTYTCPVCKWVNTTYPSFIFLNLPIPNKEDVSRSTFRVFPYSNNLFYYVEISMYGVDKFTSIAMIKKKINQYKMFSKSKIEAVLYENNELVNVLNDNTLIYDYLFPRYDFSDEYFVDYEIVFMEKPEIKDDKVNIYITPIVFEEEKGWFSTKQNIIAITYGKLFQISEKATIKDLEKEIFKYYRRGIDDKYKADEDENVDDSYYTDFYQRLNDNEYMDEEFNKYFEQNEKFDIYIYHNLPKNDGWFLTGKKCEFCGYSAQQKCCCKLNYFEDSKIREIINKISDGRNLFLVVNFKKYEHMFKIFYQSFIDETDPRMSLRQDTTIYDCFEIYSQEKKLTNEKNFYCSKCTRNVCPIQRIYPYSTPKYLVLGIKRIKKKFDDLIELLNNKKDTTFVGYPLENFDVRHYFLSKANSTTPCLYNLRSVVLHIGTVKKANYKTIIKRKDNWYEIEDTHIKAINVDEVINPNAYILIYEKADKSNDNQEISNNSDVINNISNEIQDIKIDEDNEDDENNNDSGRSDKKFKKFEDEEIFLKNEDSFKMKAFGELQDI